MVPPAAGTRTAPPPDSAPAEQMFGYYIRQVRAALRRLGVLALLEEGMSGVDALAAATGAHAGTLRRMLRALATVGEVDEVAPGDFRLVPAGPSAGPPAAATGTSSAESGGSPGGRNWDALLNRVWSQGPSLERVFSVESFLYCALTGEPAFDRLFGTDAFSYFARHPDVAASLHAATAAATRRVAPAIAAGYDFGRFGTVVDVGGGDGTLMEAVLAAYPTVRAVVLDTPGAAGPAAQHLGAEPAIAARCRFVEGSFFDGVPAGGDCYVLKSVIHDWDDDDSTRILRRCRQVLPASGRLLLVESVLPECADRTPALQRVVTSDLSCLLMSQRGRERTAAEFRALLDRAGFVLTGMAATRPASHLGLLEAAPG